MRGQEKIIESRISGYTPAIVFMNDYPCKTDWFEQRDHATVCTYGDPISSMDVRFLVGLKVSISATDEARAKALFELAKKAGAKTVGACHVQRGVPGWKQSGWADVWHKEGQ